MRKLVLKLTHKLWNQRISAILCGAYSDGHIDSKQLHLLASRFDPSQDHDVY